MKKTMAGLIVCALVWTVEAKSWPGFNRGMGVGGWLTNYKRFNVLPEDRRLKLTVGDFEHFNTYITDRDVNRIADWGFDHVRVGFDQIVLEETPYKYRENVLKRLDAFVTWCSNRRLNVVLNLHKALGNYCDIPSKKPLVDDPEMQRRVTALWLELERRYHTRKNVAFELLNEVTQVDPAKWNDFADRMIRAIREQNPTRPIVVGPVGWNNPPNLATLKVWDDPNVIYTFHMYEPFEFTHQRGVLQAGPLFYNRTLEYPTFDVARYRGYHELHGNTNSYPKARAVDAAVLAERLKGALDFQAAHPDKVLWLGEFGTIRHAPAKSRVNWMSDVIGFARKHGIPYCVWNYLSTPNDGNRFSLVDDDTRQFLSEPLRFACLGGVQTLYVSTGGKTNAAYTASDPGAWQGIPAELARRRAWARKERVAVHEERIVFRRGTYAGLSLDLGGYERADLRLVGESGNPSEVVFDGRGAKGRALTFRGDVPSDACAITFCNYETEGAGGAVLRGCYSNCVFRANAATVAGGAGAGGAGFTCCLFERNRAPRAAAVAGGQYNRQVAFARNCTFRKNSAPNYDEFRDRGQWSDTTLGLGVIAEGNKMESWDRGQPGRTDGKPGLDRLELKVGEDINAALRRLRAERTPGKRAELVLGDGVHVFTNKVQLCGFDNALTIKAKNRGRAILTTGWTFRGTDAKPLADKALLRRLDESVRGKVVAIDVPPSVASNLVGFTRFHDFVRKMPILTVDTRYMQPARWPNVPSMLKLAPSNLVGKVGHKQGNGVVSNAVVTLAGRERRWDLAQQPDAFHYRVGGFEARPCRLGPGLPGMGGVELRGEPNVPCCPCFAEYVFEEIDVPGEWCFDRESGKLVFYPPEGFGPASVGALATAQHGFFRSTADDLRLEGLVFTAETADWCVHGGMAKRNEVAGCRFSGVGCGVEFNGGEDNVIRSCDFEYLHCTAASVAGGDMKRLVSPRNRIENCLMDHCTYLGCGCALSSAKVFGVGNSMAHCVIRHTREHAMQWGGLDCVVEYCRMYDATREYRDSGVCYSPCTRTTHACKIRFNDVSGSTGQSHGIYPDDFSSGHLIYGNVVRNVGWGAIFLGGGRNCVISNNVICATDVMALHNDNRGLFWSAWCNTKPEEWRAGMIKDLDFEDGPVGRRWPDWKTWTADGKWLFGNVDDVWVNNIVIDSPNTQDQVCLEKYIPLERQISKGNVSIGLRRAPCTEVWRFGGFTNVDLRATPQKLFKDVPPRERIREPGNPFEQYKWRLGDFNLAADSILPKVCPGFKAIPWDKIGLYKDQWRTELDQEKEYAAPGSVTVSGDGLEVIDTSYAEAEFKGGKEAKLAITGVGIHYCWLQVKDLPSCTVNVAGNDFKVGAEKPVKGWLKLGQAMLPTGWTAVQLKGDNAETSKALKVVLTTSYDWKPVSRPSDHSSVDWAAGM